MDRTPLKVVTRVVDVPNVGPMFRRAYVAPGGEEVRVEYMTVVESELLAPSAPGAVQPVPVRDE